MTGQSQKQGKFIVDFCHQKHPQITNVKFRIFACEETACETLNFLKHGVKQFLQTLKNSEEGGGYFHFVFNLDKIMKSKFVYVPRRINFFFMNFHEDSFYLFLGDF